MCYCQIIDFRMINYVRECYHSEKMAFIISAVCSSHFYLVYHCWHTICEKYCEYTDLTQFILDLTSW